MKSTLVKKKIGDKTYNHPKSETIVVKEIVYIPMEKKTIVVSQSEYSTNDESIVIVKDTPHCNLILDHTKNKSIAIKAMTKVTISTNQSLIDEYYEELVIEKGACVELEYHETSWYIISSDGLKLN